MEQKWNVSPGIVFWIDGDKGFVANIQKHTQFECERSIISFLEKKTDDIGKQDLALLEEKGIIEWVDHEALFEKFIKLKKKKPFDGIIYLDVTRKCNLRCLGCFNDSGIHNLKELTFEKAKEIFDVLKGIGNPKVIITGGEPLSIRQWFEIIGLFSTHFRTEIFSNGTLISKSTAYKLKEINVSSVKISIDGAKAETHDRLRGVNGAFDRTMMGLQNLKEAGIPITWQATISKINFHELNEMIDIAENLGVDKFKASPMRPIGRAANTDLTLSVEQELELTEVLEENKSRKINISTGESFCDVEEDWRQSLLLSNDLDNTEKEHLAFIRSSMCDVGIDRFMFNFNGELCLCPLLSSEDFILEKSTTKVSKSTLQSNKLSDKFKVPLSKMNPCGSCGVKYLCKGSCRGEVFAYCRSLEGCNIRQKRYFDYMFKKHRDVV